MKTSEKTTSVGRRDMAAGAVAREFSRGSFIPWLGTALIGTFWLINWTLPGIRTHWAFFPLWFGYCLLVDGAVSARTSSSPLTRSRRAYLGLFLISIPVWWLFELINWHTQNWFYEGRQHFSDLEFFLLSSICFSVVMPAVFSTAELVSTFAWVRKLKDGPSFPLKPWTPYVTFAAGMLMIILIILWPNYYYPLVWGALYLVVESFNLRLGYGTLLAYVSRGDWRPVVSLGLGSLICGFFWELWNYHSYPKWIYQIPYVDFLHVFEMPLLGYLGYLPFAWELFAIYHFVIGVTGHENLSNYILTASQDEA